MLYSEIRPTLQLAKYVKCYWTLSGESDNYDPDSVAPDGSIEMVLNLAKPFRRHYSGGRTELQPATFIVGQMTQAVVIQPTGQVSIIGVRFHPHGFYRFIRQATHELTDRILDCQNIWGRSVERLEDRIREASVAPRQIAILEAFLIGLIEGQRNTARTYERVRTAVRMVQFSRGKQPVEKLAESLGMSPRHLERQFRLVVGLSPKSLGRIVRFQHALRLVRNGRAQAADIAIDCGYYDQAHLIHDFKCFSDQPPSAYRAADHLLGRHFIEPEIVSDFSNTREPLCG